jgi:tetratricopeptide (TPR) repeat protein
MQDLAEGLRARAAWMDGRRDEAVSIVHGTRKDVRFDQTYLSPFASQTYERFMLAEWLEQLGRHKEALPWYNSFEGASLYDLAYAAPAHFRQGRIHEQLGRTEQAVAHYRRFVTLWAECDPELRGAVGEGVAALARLGVAAD